MAAEPAELVLLAIVRREVETPLEVAAAGAFASAGLLPIFELAAFELGGVVLDTTGAGFVGAVWAGFAWAGGAVRLGVPCFAAVLFCGACEPLVFDVPGGAEREPGTFGVFHCNPPPVEFGGAAVELLPVVGPVDGAEFAGVLAANPGDELLGELLGELLELLAAGAFLTPGFSSGAGVAARGVPGRDPDDRGFQLSCKKLSMNSDEFSPVPDSASCISPGAGTAVPPGPTNGGSPASGFLAGLSAFAGFVAGGASTGFKSGWPLATRKVGADLFSCWSARATTSPTDIVATGNKMLA